MLCLIIIIIIQVALHSFNKDPTELTKTIGLYMYSKTFFVISFFLFTSISNAQFIGGWHDTDSLNIGRFDHAAINLNNGYIMVAGGYTETDPGGTIVTELFNTTTQRWEYGPPMNKGRAYHHLVRMNDGSIMAIGGFAERTCEILDLNDWTWSYTDSVNVKKYWWGRTSTLMEDGNILITGGANFDSSFASCEIYDVDSGKWRLTGKLKTSRERHIATLLNDGRILVTGGRTHNQSPFVYQKSCEIFDPVTEIWSYVDSMEYPRIDHSATLLPDGRMLVVGGEQTICEIYNPTTNQWSEAGSVEFAFGYNNAFKLSNNKYLLLIQYDGTIRGQEGWELFSLESFESIGYSKFDRKILTMKSAKINDNSVIVMGGLERIGMNYVSANYCQIYDLTTGIEETVNEQVFAIELNSYPNPFNSSANITLNLPASGKVSLSVFNILGEKVTTIHSGYLTEGNHIFNYTPTNISSGTYFLQLQSQQQTKSIKLIYLK